VVGQAQEISGREARFACSRCDSETYGQVEGLVLVLEWMCLDDLTKMLGDTASTFFGGFG
jgi:hypothetical protein